MSVILTIYWKDLATVGNEALKNEMTSYMLAVPFLLAFMIYRKRRILRAVVPSRRPETLIGVISEEELIGLMVCLSAFFIYMYGSYAFYTLEYHLISLPLFVTGCVLLMFNYRTLKELAFPIAFLLLLIPPPAETLYRVGAQLSVLTSNVAYNLLKRLGLLVELSSIYGAPTISILNASGKLLSFTVDIPCAGIYSLLGFTVFALFVFHIARGSAWKRGVLFSMGFLLMLGLNIMRIVVTVLIGYWMNMEIALGLFHMFGGLALIFIGTLVLLLIGEKTKLFDLRIKPRSCSFCEKSQQKKESFCFACGRLLKPPNEKVTQKEAYKILALLTAAIIIANLQLPAFVSAHGNPTEIDIEKIGVQETRQFLPNITEYELNFLYRDTEFEERMHQEASLAYAYYPNNLSRAPIFVSIEIVDSRSKIHHWEFCLITTPQASEKATSLELKDVQILENPPLIGHFFVFHPSQSNQTIAVLYWYETVIFKAGSNLGRNYVKTSLIAYADYFVERGEIDTPQEYSKLEKKLLPFAQRISSYWEPIKCNVWSMLVLSSAKWGVTITIITMITTAIAIGLRVTRARKKRNEDILLHKQLNWYSRFLDDERLTSKVVDILAKDGASAGIDIAESYKKSTGKSIRPSKLIEIIKHAETSGLIKKEIINKNDEPFIVWKKSG